MTRRDGRRQTLADVMPSTLSPSIDWYLTAAHQRVALLEGKSPLQVYMSSDMFDRFTFGKVAAESNSSVKQRSNMQEEPPELHTAVAAATLFPSQEQATWQSAVVSMSSALLCNSRPCVR